MFTPFQCNKCHIIIASFVNTIPYPNDQAVGLLFVNILIIGFDCSYFITTCNWTVRVFVVYSAYPFHYTHQMQSFKIYSNEFAHLDVLISPYRPGL